MNFETFIKVKNELEATHSWPEASQFFGDSIKFLEVAHRHIFKIETLIKVTHEDRDLEFFIIKNKIKQICNKLYPIKDGESIPRLGRKSCETIAKEIIDELLDFYPGIVMIQIAVSEDGENEGIVKLERN